MKNILINSVKEAIFSSKEYDNLLKKIAKDIVIDSHKANSEETIATRIESGIVEALHWHQVDFKPIREENVKKNTISSNKSGRIDSRFQNIICEYKKNITQNSFSKNIKQLKDYIHNVSKNESQVLDRYVGVLTDGKQIAFLSFIDGKSNLTSLMAFNKTSFKEFIGLYLSLDKKNLSAQNLLSDFSIDNRITRKLMQKLYSLLDTPTDKTFMLHSEWERLFKLASNNPNNNSAIIRRDKILSEYLAVDLEILNQSKALFAIQTAYTIIIKLVAYYIVDNIFFSQSELKFDNFKKLDSESLRARLEQIENGDIFKDLGIYNLLEGDFFSWYVDEETWDNELYSSINECTHILSVYDNNQLIFSENNIHDLFIDLYESIVPKEVRHSLGEYYTPNWLSEHVLENTTLTENWNGLDPCTGSGTFVLQMINKVIGDTEHSNIINEVINRVKGIDINPVAVLTCRINYFIAISKYIDFDTFYNIEIPIYLGDSAYVPLITEEQNVTFINHTIFTKKGQIDFSLPKSILFNWKMLQALIPEMELAIVQLDKPYAMDLIISLVAENEKNAMVIEKIEKFVDSLIYLEEQNWDRIWIRIIIGFLRIATLGKFELIIGNPPWIDWKSLPDGYRDTIKGICIDRHLFSGDSHTGGINLNICALIVNVVANNWLQEEGTLAFLMPKSILFQQSYSGFRKLKQNDNIDLKFTKIVDWAKAGNPFSPVTEKFATYYLKKTTKNQKKFIPTLKMKLAKKIPLKDARNKKLSFIRDSLVEKKYVATMNNHPYNNFIFSDDQEKLDYIINISGESHYKGRVGLGLYPKELLLFRLIELKGNNRGIFENYQGRATEKKFMRKNIVLETKYLHPVIEAPNIERFGIKNIKYYSPFPYIRENRKKPIEASVLRKESPLLYKYYINNKKNLVKTNYNDKIQGSKGEFYSLTRVGDYSFAEYRVIYRNNTKWVSTVVENSITEWGESKNFLLLDHACSISQTNTGEFITKNEAHYICAVLNSSIVEDLIMNSSDSRSFKSDITLNIKKFNQNSWVHNALSLLSEKAHSNNIEENIRDEFLDILVELYIDSDILNKKSDDIFSKVITFLNNHNGQLDFIELPSE